MLNIIGKKILNFFVYLNLCKLGTFNLGEITTVETGDGGALCYSDEGVTMVSFVLVAAKSGQSVFRDM